MVDSQGLEYKWRWKKIPDQTREGGGPSSVPCQGTTTSCRLKVDCCFDITSWSHSFEKKSKPCFLNVILACTAWLLHWDDCVTLWKLETRFIYLMFPVAQLVRALGLTRKGTQFRMVWLVPFYEKITLKKPEYRQHCRVLLSLQVVWLWRVIIQRVLWGWIWFI